MSSNMGLWIDHKQAVIVTLPGKETAKEQHDASGEHQPHHEESADPKGEYETLTVHAHHSHSKETDAQLNHYYDDVIKHLQDAGSILIFGPGEAKEELKKRFEGHHHAAHIVGVQTADKMTENQVVAKVKEHYK